MTISYFLSQLATFFAAAAPISLLFAVGIPKIFSKQKIKIAKTTTICTPIANIFTKETLLVKSLYFDKYKAKLEENSNLLKFLDTETNTEIEIDRKDLQQDQTINLIAATMSLCHYPKMHQIESTISQFLKSCAIDLKRTEEKYQIIEKIPSNDEKKISTVVAVNILSKEIFSFSKGNPKSILKKCTRVFINGKKEEINHNLHKKLLKRIEKINHEGQKAIAFAYKGLPVKRLEKYTENFTENDMVLLGIVGLGDIIDLSLNESIEEIKKNHIKIYITASEKKDKTVAIAEELKMINPHYFEAITGKDLEDLNDQKLSKMLSNKEKDFVFCETKPSDRIRIIELLKKDGEIIATPNKKVGFRELAEMIKNARRSNFPQPKILFHAISCKISQLILFLLTILFGAPLPLGLKALIGMDLFINTPLELALRSNSPEKNDQNNKRHTIVNGILIGVIITAIHFWNLVRHGWYPGEEIPANSEIYIKSATIIFVLLSLIQIIKVLGKSNLKKIQIQLTIIVTALILYLLLYFEPMKNYFQLSKITNQEWQIIVFSVMIVYIIEYLIHRLKMQPNEFKNSP